MRNALSRNSRYSKPSEKSRLVRDFGSQNIEPVYEQQRRKLEIIQKPLPEVTVIKDM